MTKSWWPQADDVVFHEGFDPDTTAELDWFGMGTQAAYASGYSRAAGRLIEDAAEGRLLFHPDNLLYPIVFLFRHSIEIRLKLVIAAASHFLTSGIDFDRLHSTHSLHSLWNRAKELVQEARPDSVDLPFGDAERILLQLHEKDPGGVAFRYSLTKEGKPHGLNKVPRRVDLGNLRDVINRLENFLDTLLAIIDEAAQADFEL